MPASCAFRARTVLSPCSLHARTVLTSFYSMLVQCSHPNRSVLLLSSHTSCSMIELCSYLPRSMVCCSRTWLVPFSSSACALFFPRSYCARILHVPFSSRVPTVLCFWHPNITKCMTQKASCLSANQQSSNYSLTKRSILLFTRNMSNLR